MDKERNFTPYRVIKRKAGLTSVYSDHFSFKVILSGMPSSRSEMKSKETIWNMNKPGGWEVYATKTKEASAKLEEIIDDETNSIDDVM